MTFSVENIYELLKKHGLLLLVVIWLKNDNESLYNRLDIVEERLYDCYEARVTADSQPMTDKRILTPERTYAILPSKCKSVKECLA